MTEEGTLKVYNGHAAEGERPLSVTVSDWVGRNRDRKGLLCHHVRHSPSGFNWGYAGSGPSDLSRCILLDAFGVGECAESPEECKCEDNSWAEVAYPAFRDAVVANLTQDEDWKLQQTFVVDWVFDYIQALDDVSQGEVLVPSP